MGTNTLASYNAIGITLTSGGGYLSPFTITQAGSVVTGLGTSGVYSGLTSPSLVNEGLINGGFNGVNFTDGGTVDNGAAISGDNTAVFISSADGVVLNDGELNGGRFVGVYLGDGGSVTNTGGASIYGYFTGVDIRGSAGTVTNFGTVSGPRFDGVYLQTFGYVSNNGPSSDIVGSTGIDMGGEGAGTVVNAGMITGTGGTGVFLAGGGTVVNAGTISGNTAVYLGSSGNNNRLVVEPGAVFDGAVIAGVSGNYNVLELAAGAGQTTLSGIGTSFTGFNTIDFDGGATWLVTGDVAGFDGDSISGFAVVDTIDVTDLDFTGPSMVTADGAGVVTIPDSNGSFDLTFSSAYDDDVFSLASDGAGGTDIAEYHGFTYANIYGVYDPGAYPTGYAYGEIFPTGINDAGEAVGYYQTGASGAGLVFAGFTTSNGSYTGFGPTIVGGTSVSGYYPAAVNDGGEVAGYLIRDDGPRIPFTYEDGTLTTFGVIDTLTSFGNFYATGINDSGAVAGYYNGYSTDGLASEETAFLYENGTFTSLPNPANEETDLTTAGINDSNEIAGYFFDGVANTQRGFIYNNGSYTTLSGPGADEWVQANTINDSGEVVGFFDTPPEVHGQQIEGFIYNDGSYTTLSGPPGALHVDPVAINDSGEVAGTYILQDGFTEYGFVYQNGTYTTIADPTGTSGSGGGVVNDIVTGLNNAGDVTGYYAMAGTEYGFVADPACFAAGTGIMTSRGKVAVEKLQIGDMVIAAGGDCVPVRWIGISTVVAKGFDPLRVLPVRIRAGALGEKMPERDLLVSPDHALFLGGILVQAGALVNGGSITRAANMPTGFTYYHVEVANHALILAEGVAAETFVDNISRMAFDNWAEHLALYGGEAEIAEMRYPRAKSARQLPASLRRLLVDRAAAHLMGHIGASPPPGRAHG